MSKFKNIFEAAMSGNIKDVKFFIETKGIDVNSRVYGDWEQGSTALHLGAQSLEKVKYLIEKGANVNVENSRLETPLHRLCGAIFSEENIVEYLKIATLLIQNGAMLNGKDYLGFTPLHNTVLYGGLNYKMVELLLSNGASTSLRNNDGDTPLSAAEFVQRKHGYDNSKLIDLLKSKDGESKDGGCYIATAVYGSYNCQEVVVLRNFRDDILSQNSFGRSLIKIYYAISPTIVKLFGKTKVFNMFWKKVLGKFVSYLQPSRHVCEEPIGKNTNNTKLEK